MIVLTNESHVKELEKLVKKEPRFTLNNWKDLIFSVQDSKFGVVKTEIKATGISILITSNYLTYIAIDVMLENSDNNEIALTYKVKNSYTREIIEQGSFINPTGNELGEKVKELEEELNKINEDTLVLRDRDSLYHDIIKQGYRTIKEFEYNENGEKEYIVRYVDIPELESRSLHLPEAVDEVTNLFEEWAMEIAEIGGKPKLPKVTPYVEDNLDTPRDK